MPEQDVMTIPILEGLDGVNKMSKSLGNYIGLDEKPAIMYGKIMSVPDNLIVKYAQLLTDLPISEMEAGAKENPRAAKMKLARELVKMYHSEKAAQKAEEEFVRVVSHKEAPSEVESVKLKAKSLVLVDLLVETKMASSKSEARRLVEQGGVRLNEERQSDPMKMVRIEGEMLLQVGKRKFLKLTA
jgi:tyrosyl-tRNA synthetase